MDTDTLFRIGAWLLILALACCVVSILHSAGRTPSVPANNAFTNGGNMDSDEDLRYGPGDLDEDND